MGQGRIRALLIDNADIFKFHAGNFFLLLLFFDCSFRHTRFLIQNLIDTGQTGQRLGYINDQIGQLNQLHENLGHIVDQRHHLALAQDSRIYLPAAGPYQQNHRCIDNRVSQGIQKPGNPAHEKLSVHKDSAVPMKGLHLLLLPVECPYHTDTGQVFPHMKQHPIQLTLHFPIPGNRNAHNREYHDKQYRDNPCKYRRRLHINGKGHDHGSKHDKWGT